MLVNHCACLISLPLVASIYLYSQALSTSSFRGKRPAIELDLGSNLLFRKLRQNHNRSTGSDLYPSTCTLLRR